MTQAYRVRAAGSGWTGAPGLLTVYYGEDAPDTTSAAGALEAGKRVRAFLVQLQAEFPASISWDVSEQVDVLNVQSGALVGGWGIANQSAVAGTGTGNLAPPNVCHVIQFLTSSIAGTRRVRGRSYFGPIVVGRLDSAGNPTSTAVSNVLAAAALLGTQITTALTHEVWHRPVNGSGGSIKPVTSYAVWSRAGSLRSRRD